MKKPTSVYIPQKNLSRLDRLAKSDSQQSFNTRNALINLAIEGLLSWRSVNPWLPLAHFASAQLARKAKKSNHSKND